MNNMHMSLNRYYISVKLIMQSQCVQQGYYQSSYLQNSTLLFFLNCALKCNKSYTDILVCPLKLICVAETKRCIRKRNMIFILQNFLFLNKKIYKSMKFMVRIFFFLFRAAHAACGSSQARGQIEAFGSQGSKPHLRPILQLMAVLDPSPTEQGQGSNPHPLSYQLNSFPLHHDRNSGHKI